MQKQKDKKQKKRENTKTIKEERQKQGKSIFYAPTHEKITKKSLILLCTKSFKC